MPPSSRSKKAADRPSIIGADPDTLPDYVHPDGYAEEDVEPDADAQPKHKFDPNVVNPNYLYKRFPKMNNSYPLNHRLVKRENMEWERKLPDGTTFSEKLKVSRSNNPSWIPW